jgi:hypothetical protein
MYVDGYMLFAIYFIAVLALAVSAYALWSLEEIRKFYQKYYEKSSRTNSYTATNSSRPTPKRKSHWD